eukprot:6454894-Amphidinium_carterae.1
MDDPALQEVPEIAVAHVDVVVPGTPAVEQVPQMDALQEVPEMADVVPGTPALQQVPQMEEDMPPVATPPMPVQEVIQTKFPNLRP